jgi:hypothetical protein
MEYGRQQEFHVLVERGWRDIRREDGGLRDVAEMRGWVGELGVLEESYDWWFRV